MDLQREEWALLLRHLDTALDLPEAERLPWLDAFGLEPPRLKAALRQLLIDRPAIETADFLGAGARIDARWAGTTLGPWALLRELGQGGMASVWLAQRRDGVHHRPVALKLPHSLFGAPVIAERFERERAILSTLAHPHIAQVLDAGVEATAHGAQPWLALEFVDGLPITEHATSRGLDTRARLRLFLPVLQAVQHAHAQLVIHRDLKPANVLVTNAGDVKLLDFGVAKLLAPDGAAFETALTRLGGRAMTPQYASPEQVAGRPLGVASDVYSLGVLLYELLTGKLPYQLQRDTAAALEEAILGARIVRPSLAVRDPRGARAQDDKRSARAQGDKRSARAQGDKRSARALRGDIDTLVLKALAADPTQRYASAAALADDIERHLQALPIRARPASLGYRAPRFATRQTVPLAVAAALSASLLVGSGVAFWQARVARLEAHKAEAIKDYLLGLFRAADTREVGGKERGEMTVLQLIANGAQRLTDDSAQRSGGALADQPEVKIELLGVVGDLFEALDQPGRSIALWEQAAQLSQQQQGENNPVRAHHLLGIANAQAFAGHWAEAGAALARCEAVLAALGDTGSATYATALRLKGMLLRRQGPAQVAQARAVLRQAATLFDTRYPQNPERIAAWIFLAQTHMTLDALAEARSAADHAVAAAQQMVSVRAANDLADAHSVRASVLERSGLFSEALADYRAAATGFRSTVGAEHFFTLQNDNLMGQALQATGERAAGLALMQRSAQDIARVRPGSNTHGNAQLRLGQALLRDGEPAAARPALAEAEAVARQRNDVNPRVGALLALARADLAEGRAEAARAQVEAALAAQRASGVERPALVADTDLLLARVALRENQPDEAERRIAAALALSLRDARPDQLRRAQLLALRGQAEAGRKDTVAALASTERALALATLPSLASDWPLRAELLTERGRALCAAGRGAEGRAQAEAALQLRSRHQSPASVDLAATRAVLAACTSLSGTAATR
ncbi:MAG: serine/threonine protein kinase [Rhizobacter sp.]|nr:serine/threonine protein kinase [Rhizobacter sp.]